MLRVPVRVAASALAPARPRIDAEGTAWYPVQASRSEAPSRPFFVLLAWADGGCQAEEGRPLRRFADPTQAPTSWEVWR